MVYTHRFVSSKCSLFHNSNLFGSCIIHVLYTGCAKIKNKIRRQNVNMSDQNGMKLCILSVFSLQNAVCFIIITCLVPVLFIFYIQNVLKLKKNPAPKR